jgi:hypothetical protein
MIIKDWEDRTYLKEDDGILFRVRSKSIFPIVGYEIKSVNEPITELDFFGPRKIIRFINSYDAIKYIYIIPASIKEEREIKKFAEEIYIIVKLMDEI